MIIEASEQLIDICHEAAKSPYVAFDTEFARRKGLYYPEPSLVQFSYDGKKGFVCDTLNSKVDLQPLISLLTKNDVIKIFHSARQDLQVLYKLFAIKPYNIFDVQTASMFLGYNNNPSYDCLVKTFLGVVLDKQLQFSDWMLRPLSAKHIEYAECDVTYLYRLFPAIREALGEEKYQWVHEEMNYITQAAPMHELNEILETMALNLLNKKRSINPRCLCLLKMALQWREEYSLQYNIVRNNIIDGDSLNNLVFRIDKRLDDANLMKLPKSRTQRLILKMIKDRISLIENLDEFEKLMESTIKKRDVMRDKHNSLYPLLQSVLKECSHYYLIDQQFIAPKKDLIKITADKFLPAKFREGWRYEVFGSRAEKVLNS